MDPWQLSVSSVSPLFCLLSRAVGRGSLRQEDVQGLSMDAPVFSSRLLEAEQRSRTRKELLQVQLDMELLQLEKNAADVTHSFYLNQRFQVVQAFTSHLQDVLKEQSDLRQRLMKPLCHSSLPIQAPLHRCVVEVLQMVVDFIKNLEHHMTSVQSACSVGANMADLNSSVLQVLDQVTQVQNFSKLLLQWKEQHSSLLSENCQ